MTNDDLQLDVAAELSWDPKVDSRAIAVSADDGAVALRGTVGSFREKREAGKAAARVYGVTEVSNELQVRVLDGSRRGDADLRGDVLQALMLDSLVPIAVDPKVRGTAIVTHRDRGLAVSARRGRVAHRERARRARYRQRHHAGLGD